MTMDIQVPQNSDRYYRLNRDPILIIRGLKLKKKTKLFA